jgi:hypothetical protein
MGDSQNGSRFGSFERLTDAYLVRPSFCEAYKHGIEIVAVLFLNYPIWRQYRRFFA